MNSGDKVRNIGIAMLLAASLLFGQWSAFAHKLDLDSHSAGHVCEWCVAHAGLDQLIVDATVHAAGAAPAAAPAEGVRAGVRLVPLLHYPARAPPPARSQAIS